LLRTESSPRPGVKSRPSLESLETRTLLSASAVPANLLHLMATRDVTKADRIFNGANVAPFAPNSLRTAYGVNRIQFPNGSGGFVKGNGAGQTIAIIDAGLDPFIAADLHTFDSISALPDPPSFTVLNQNGGTDLSAVPPNSSAVETSLDVEWAHSIAPGANIVLFEANSLNFLNTGAAYLTAANPATYTALGLTPAGVISNSFGANETGTLQEPFRGTIGASSEASLDAMFYQPVSAAGKVTGVFSSGDDAAQNFPSTSPYVLSVGGSTLTAKTTPFGVAYSSETAWSAVPAQEIVLAPGITIPTQPTGEAGSGGGTALFEPVPTFQSNFGINVGGNRATPDVSWDANPASGVYITDTLDAPGSPVFPFIIGGTSLSAPLWAGLLTDVNQGRALLGEGPLANAQEAVYKVPATDFHDITSGNNIPATAGVGYDEVTGRGTPIANLLVPDLVNQTTGPVSVPGPAVVTAGSLTAVSGNRDAEGISGHQTPDSVAPQVSTPELAVALATAGQQDAGFRNLTVSVVEPAAPSVSQVVQVRTPSTAAVYAQTTATAQLVQDGGGDTVVVDTAVPADTSAPADVPVTPTAAPLATPAATPLATPVPATVAGTISDAVFADIDSLPPVQNQISAPLGIVASDEAHPVDPAMLAGMALALGGLWTAFVRVEETRKYPALRR
jgi:hypothetical protein